MHCYDHTTWQDFVTRRGEAWTRDQMLRAVHRFREVFGVKPQVHGAAGWQMNEAALELEEEMGFLYASDTRGQSPFVPLLFPPAPQPQRRSACPQLPTTLPTLDELIGVNGITADNVHEALLERTRVPRASQVFTLHAELEGMKVTLFKVFEEMMEEVRQGRDVATDQRVELVHDDGELRAPALHLLARSDRAGPRALRARRCTLRPLLPPAGSRRGLARP